MNEQDFEKIGRRLYEQEAEPPRNGWKKIAAGIRSPKPAGKLAWLRKNFWIPLLVIFPVALYLYPRQTSLEDLKLASSIAADTTSQQTEPQSPRLKTPDKADENNLNIQEPLGAPGEEDTQRTEKEKSQPITRLTPARPADKIALSKSLALANETKSLNREHDNDEGAVEMNSGKKYVAENHDQELTAPTRMNGHDARPLNAFSSLADKGSNETEGLPSALPSAKTEKEILITPQQDVVAEDSVSSGVMKKEEAVTNGSHWRISASFTPYYTTRSVRPIATDEVFVTDIDNGDNKFADRISLGFAFGVGKAITQQFYIDAHLSFSQSKQNTFYSYSTGNVDTLLAVEQEDQSVRIIPVYQEIDGESKSKYTYGGIRLGATYYFLSTSGGRLNIAAAAGLSYLLSSTVKEKTDGQWITLSNEDLNKVNYSVIVGAGYNITFNKGWELMINPSLTYNLRQVKNNQLPYQLNQRPFGLNIMLSKALGM
jgi:hypothetical protein